MTKTLTSISTGSFLFTLLCFAMPFVTVSCQHQKIMSLNGVQLVTGFEVQGPGGFSGSANAKRESPEPIAIGAALCAIAGLILSIKKAPPISRVIVALGGVLCMVFLSLKFDSELTKQGPNPLEITYGIGYWLALLSYVAAGVVNGIIIKTSSAENSPHGNSFG